MTMQWLLCLVGSTRVSLPTRQIELIVEYDVGPPPPLTSPYVAGIGLVDDKIFLSVRVGFRPTARTRRTKGVLLTGLASQQWAFEIDTILGFSTEAPKDLLQSEPSWLTRTRAGERYLDADAMRAVLSGELRT